LRYWHDNYNKNDITDNAYPSNRKYSSHCMCSILKATYSPGNRFEYPAFSRATSFLKFSHQKFTNAACAKELKTLSYLALKGKPFGTYIFAIQAAKSSFISQILGLPPASMYLTAIKYSMRKAEPRKASLSFAPLSTTDSWWFEYFVCLYRFSQSQGYVPRACVATPYSIPEFRVASSEANGC